MKFKISPVIQVTLFRTYSCIGF